MISDRQVENYHRDGFLVVENLLDGDEVTALGQVTDDFVARAKAIADHDNVYDLEPSHSDGEPRVRRIKAPHLHHEVYDRAMRHPAILAVLQRLIGPAIRADNGKLNMKSAGYGAAVEWHQDWAFYPHTNDDLCAVGIMIDDCTAENGPLLCIPGSHKGPIHDHHAMGRFCGAIDPTGADMDAEAAVPLTGRAGAVTIHHVRTVHGSAVNTADRARRLLLFQYRAADAWPLLGIGKTDFDGYHSMLLCGDNDPAAPRCTDVPVRLPLPPAAHQGSIYENQRTLENTYFDAASAFGE